MRKTIASVLAGAAFVALAPCLIAQQGPATQGEAIQSTPDFHGEFFTREQVIKYTSYWNGERFPDGRPKVPDDILDRMKTVTLEEAWATLREPALCTSMKMAGIPSIPIRYWWAGR